MIILINKNINIHTSYMPYAYIFKIKNDAFYNKIL